MYLSKAEDIKSHFNLTQVMYFESALIDIDTKPDGRPMSNCLKMNEFLRKYGAAQFPGGD